MMIWVLLYIYVIGTINDLMFAVIADADMSDWKTHVTIAFWPISVPVAIGYTIWEQWYERG
jgi:hypothetical protein